MNEHSNSFLAFLQSLINRAEQESFSPNTNRARYIFNLCVKAIEKILYNKDFLNQYADVIDARMASIYQILEARTMADYDGDILKIMDTFLENIGTVKMNIFRSVCDLHEIYLDLLTFSSEFSIILNHLLAKSTQLFKDAAVAQRDEDMPHAGVFTRDIVRLAGTMAKASLTTAPSTSSSSSSRTTVDIEVVNSGMLSCQYVIQVIWCLKSVLARVHFEYRFLLS